MEVQKIIQLQHITTQLLDVTIDAKGMTKFHIQAANTLASIVIPQIIKGWTSLKHTRNADEKSELKIRIHEIAKQRY